MSLFNELKMHPCIYTMESSFCGNDRGPYAKYHFSTDNLMQTGIDFCRSLLIHQSIALPLQQTEQLLKNIQFILNHYQRENEKLEPNYQDQNIINMQLYEEKLKNIRASGTQMSTHQIMKALRKVLRQTEEIFSENETQSSQGSDRAPSEDNLNVEEMVEVVPVEEDPDLMLKAAHILQNKPKKDADDVKTGGAVDKSLIKRKITLIPPKSKNGLQAR